MAQLTVTINARRYNIACQDGQEDHLQNLAAMVNKRLETFGKNGASMSEAQLLVMGSLVMADELCELKRKQNENANPTGEVVSFDGNRAPGTASDQVVSGLALQRASAQEVEVFAEALSACAEKLENIAAKLEKQ